MVGDPHRAAIRRDPFTVRAGLVEDRRRAVRWTARSRGASGHRDTKLGELTLGAKDDVEIGQQRGASSRDLDVGIAITDVHTAGAMDRETGIHAAEVARRRSKRPFPQVDLEREPSESVNGHRTIRPERDRRLAIAGGVRGRRGRQTRRRAERRDQRRIRERRRSSRRWREQRHPPEQHQRDHQSEESVHNLPPRVTQTRRPRRRSGRPSLDERG